MSWLGDWACAHRYFDYLWDACAGVPLISRPTLSVSVSSVVSLGGPVRCTACDSCAEVVVLLLDRMIWWCTGMGCCWLWLYVVIVC